MGMMWKYIRTTERYEDDGTHWLGDVWEKDEETVTYWYKDE